MLIGTYTHPLAFVLQLVAIFLALRLIPLTGKTKAWVALSVTFVLTGARRTIEWLEHINWIEGGDGLINLTDILSLVNSLVLVIGVYLIREIFFERDLAKQKLLLQLDELQRFQKLTVGRELRMKELVEENVILRCQLASESDGRQT